MNIKRRKYKNTKEKIILFLIIIVFLGLFLIFDYNFENRMYNGFILIVTMFFTAMFLGNNKFYIEFGVKDSEIKTPDQFKEYELFVRMHPFIALYNKFISISFFFALIIGLYMIISSFFV